MATRAETIVQLLFKLADESRPIRKALEPTTPTVTAPPRSATPGPSAVAVNGTITRTATPSVATEKKKRKAKENEAPPAVAPGDEENANPNPDADDDNEDDGEEKGDDEGAGEWGMSKEQRMRMFGNNAEAYELAEKDMRTITAKRTASQGGVLPQQKTKYKKRSVSCFDNLRFRIWG